MARYENTIENNIKTKLTLQKQIQTPTTPAEYQRVELVSSPPLNILKLIQEDNIDLSLLPQNLNQETLQESRDDAISTGTAAPLALQSSSEDQVSTGMKEASGMTEEERVLELRLMLQKAEEDAAVARAAIASNASNKRRKTT